MWIFLELTEISVGGSPKIETYPHYQNTNNENKKEMIKRNIYKNKLQLLYPNSYNLNLTVLLLFVFVFLQSFL